MTLATRLSLFFLSALGLVLVGFSLALYMVAGVYFNRQSTERVESALKRLAAAAEVERDRVEWEPHDRSLQFERGDATAHVSWRVTDERGRTIDRSPGAPEATTPWPAFRAPLVDQASPAIADSSDGEWRCASLRITPPDSSAARRQSEPSPGDTPSPALVIETAVPLGPMRALLARLAWLSASVSLAIWLLAAAGGRVICHRALSPLTTMAAAARAMHGDVLSQRLPAPKTGDECEDLALAFNELLSRVEEAFERQRQFTGNASHQLRTPLAAILGQTEVALRRDRPADEYRRVIALIQERAGDLRQLVDTLLFLARADGEALLPELEPVHLENWLRERLDDWAAHSRADDFRLELATIESLARIHRPLLGQLVDNLLDNACKHSSPGTPITVRLTQQADALRLEVEDEGDGIAPGDLPYIFEPFYRSQQARARGLAGSGLGLAVAQRIATAFGGRLNVESQLGAGSRFRFYLPTHQ
jgi:heavy metal sensor kinase